MGMKSVKRLLEKAAEVSATDLGALGVKADVWSESTDGAGCTADGVLLQDSGVTASGTNVLGNTTVSAAKTLAVTDADKLTVGGKIVPQTIVLTFAVPLAAGALQNLFIAPWACKVNSIKFANSVAEAVTGTVVKSTGTVAPVKTTTPMHTADAYNFNTTVHTVTTLAAAQAADRILAAGERIALVLSAALTTGASCLTIEIERQ